MISRFYFWSIILLMITSNAWSKDIKRSKDTVTPTIKWIDANSSKITIPFKKNGKQAGKIVFDRDRDNDFTINCSLHYTDGHSVEIGNVGSGVISRIGILTFGKDANERILVISETGGTGMHDIYLNLVCPRYETCIGINMTFLIAATEFVPGISTTDNYNDKRLRVEKQYLEKLKYEYDFISEDEMSKKQNDPFYAFYFWNKDSRFKSKC